MCCCAATAVENVPFFGGKTENGNSYWFCWIATKNEGLDMKPPPPPVALKAGPVAELSTIKKRSYF